MSNPSLREQLAALSSESSPTGSKEANEAKQPNESKKIVIKRPMPPKSVKKDAKISPKLPTPAWLEQARYGVELLKAHYPNCFSEREGVKPLKTGIRQDLVKQLGAHEDIALGDKACMVSSLAYYVNSVSYHKSVIEGADRVDLDGQVVGKVTVEEAHYSKSRLEVKWQKKQSITTATKPLQPVSTTEEKNKVESTE